MENPAKTEEKVYSLKAVAFRLFFRIGERLVKNGPIWYTEIVYEPHADMNKCMHERDTYVLLRLLAHTIHGKI